MDNKIDNILKSIIKKIVFEDLENEIELDDIKDYTNLIEDLGFHSILSIKLFVAIEGVLDIEIDDEDFDKDILIKYENLRRYIESIVNKDNNEINKFK